MHYSTSKFCRQAGTGLTTNWLPVAAKSLAIGAIALLSLNVAAVMAGGTAVEPIESTATQATDTPVSSAFSFQPHEAVYTGDFGGIKADMKQSFTQIDDQKWQLHNTASILFVGFVETAQFSVENNKIIAHSYEYVNKLSKKRSSLLQFNHLNHTVIDHKKNTEPMTVPANVLDKISMENQLRLDLIYSGTKFTDKVYTMVRGNKLTQYEIKYIGEEDITVPAGTFKAIKLEQRKVGDTEKTTFIWFAKELDYLLLHVTRTDINEKDMSITLKKAEINGNKI